MKQRLWAVMVIVSLFLPLGPIFAASPDDTHANLFDTVWAGGDSCSVDASVTAGGSAGDGPLYGLSFPMVSDTADLANRINAYITKTTPSSPLKTLGADFVSAGQTNNVNPAMMVGFAVKESSLGTNQPSGSNDPFGLTQAGDAPSFPFKNGIVNFPDWPTGIKAEAGYLGDNYVKPGSPLYSKTILELMQHYTPSDPKGQTSITLGVMHDILDGISTTPAPGGAPVVGSAPNTLDNYQLPATQGGTGLEEAINSAGQVPSGGTVTFAGLASKGQAYRDYYINMRWTYTSWAWDGSNSGVDSAEFNWMASKPRLVLVTNPKTHKSIIADALESGPAPFTGAPSSQQSLYATPQKTTPSGYTGRVSGFPPTAFSALGATERMSDGSGDNLEYAWAPDQNATPGPTTLEAGSGTAPTGTGCSPDQSYQGGSLGSLNIIQHDAFHTADGLMGHSPTMIGVHYTGANEQTVDQVVSDLADPTGAKHCNVSCSVQITIDPKGNVYQLTSRLDVVTENIINFNNADIGIEIMGADEQTLMSNPVQFKAVETTVAGLMKQYNIKMVQDFSRKTGLMGHFECDTWSGAHVGQSAFVGQYAGDSVQQTDGHTDPGPNYMQKLRSGLTQAGVN